MTGVIYIYPNTKYAQQQDIIWYGILYLGVRIHSLIHSLQHSRLMLQMDMENGRISFILRWTEIPRCCFKLHCVLYRVPYNKNGEAYARYWTH